MSPKTTPRWRWVLVASLALNLAVAGMVVGALVTGGPDHRQAHRSDRTFDETGTRHRRDPRLRAIGNLPFIMALDSRDRAALLDQAVGNRRALRENRRTLRARFEAVLEVLRADPLDEAALRGLLAAQRETLFERQRLGEALLLETIVDMAPEARAAYADRLDKSLRRGPRRGD